MRRRAANGETTVNQAHGENRTDSHGPQHPHHHQQTHTTQNSRPGILSQIFSWGWKIAVVALIAPPFLNYASLKNEEMHLKPEGQLYDIGWGQRLFMKCQGDGPPTVILDAPTGMSSDVWSLVWPEIANVTRVCIFDRAGLGYSDRPRENFTSNDGSEGKSNYRNRWEPFTVERMADDMRHLFTLSSQQPKPFILVGSELSALSAYFYAQMHENDVTGLVMINPIADELFDSDNGLWSRYWFGKIIPDLQLLQFGASLGISRIAIHFGFLEQPLRETSIAEQVKNRQKYLLCHPKHLSSAVDEHHFINESISQIRLARIMKNLPSNMTTTVISGNMYDKTLSRELNEAWARGERKMIQKFFSNAHHIIINGVDHHMMYKKPAAVIKPILEIVQNWKDQPSA
ncbi:Hypothetical predicted protein [Octopus vulgaris]|uniref:Uncharacterized protein n=2 Tax=Octopus TaxID=6643 RepID=A0AA36ARM1_OCTVU|nr:uncharacterized protein LOC115210732 [Octopus sinensis]CAI9721050.1 Hypothetical predicted protein [Octopus vulgaris]